MNLSLGRIAILGMIIFQLHAFWDHNNQVLVRPPMLILSIKMSLKKLRRLKKRERSSNSQKTSLHYQTLRVAQH